jgi:hypothetical protein
VLHLRGELDERPNDPRRFDRESGGLRVGDPRTAKRKRKRALAVRHSNRAT